MQPEINQLYPVFFKMDRFTTLVVGGGEVATEKLTFLLKSSPNARVKLVAPLVHAEVVALAQGHDVELIKKEFEASDLDGAQLAIAATNIPEVNFEVYEHCKERGILINVADTPPLCDFYLGGIVTKGPLKIAISTNGTSPTLAKRLRQVFEEALPSQLEDLAQSLNSFRKTLKGNFSHKVEELNRITRSLVE